MTNTIGSLQFQLFELISISTIIISLGLYGAKILLVHAKPVLFLVLPLIGCAAHKPVALESDFCKGDKECLEMEETAHDCDQY